MHFTFTISSMRQDEQRGAVAVAGKEGTRAAFGKDRGSNKAGGHGSTAGGAPVLPYPASSPTPPLHPPRPPPILLLAHTLY